MPENTNTHITPYAAAKVVNGILKDAGVDKVLPPQMFYNYTTARVNKGKAPFIKTLNGKVECEDLLRWVAAYLVKNGVEVTNAPTS